MIGDITNADRIYIVCGLCSDYFILIFSVNA